MRRIISLVAFFLVGSACFAEAQQDSIDLTAEATLQPGDTVAIEVYRQDQLSGHFQIARDGTILHPLYRTLRITGMPLSEVTEVVEDHLRGFGADPQFVLQPQMRVAVGGEVRNPDLYYMDPGVTLSQAVDRAGGVTEEGRRDRLRLIRNGREVVLSLSDRDSQALLTRVHSGDRIMVDRRINILRDYLGPVTSAVSALGTLYAFLSVVGIVGN